MARWYRSLFRKHDLVLVFAITSIVALGLYIFPYTRDFGVNAISELTTIWLTVFLINRIIEKRERRKRVSIDQRILKETLSIIASYFSIWKHLAWKYFPESTIHSEQDLIRLYPQILKAARLSGRFEIVSIHDPESWKLFFHNRSIRECFANYYESLQGDIRSLIDNFKLHLEPQLLGYLLEINESQYFREVNSIFQNDEADVLNEFGQDIDRLQSYISSDPAHFNKVAELRAYCGGLAERISVFTDKQVEIYDFKNYFRNPVLTYSRVDEKR